MSSVLDRKVVPPGTTLFREGEEGNSAFLIQEGEVQIYKATPDGGVKVLGTLGPGSIFGEMALIDGRPRMAGARTSQPSIIVQVGRRTFEEKLKKTDPFVRALLNILVRNVRDLTDRSLQPPI